MGNSTNWMAGAIAGMSMVLCAGMARGEGALWLQWGRVDTDGEAARAEESRLMARVAAKARRRDGAEERAAYAVQFGGPVRAEWRESLEGTTQVRGYLPDNAYLVWATATEMEAIAAADGVSWVGEWKKEWKRAEWPAERRDDGAREWVVESLLEGETGAADLKARLEALGATVDESFPRFWGCAATARLTDAQLEEVQGWADVEWIEPRGRAAACNDVSAGETMLDVEPVRNLMGLDGSGQVVAVADTGLDIGTASGIHPDFADRVKSGYGWTNGSYQTSASWADTGGHGTHVAGSIAGSGAASDGQFKGMAPESLLVVQGLETNFGGLPGDLTRLFRQAASEGVRLHNDSWYYTTLAQGSYPSGCALADGFMWTNQSFLAVVAAGNEAMDADGDGVVDRGSVTPPGTAKNCLCVGAAEGPRTSGGWSQKTWHDKWPSRFAAEPLRSDTISGTVPQGLVAFSGRGPTADGRFKPDVVAPGTDIVSARSRAATGTGWGVATNTNYMHYGGTSMATPLVTGTLALMRQWLEEKKGVTDPPAALLKALVVNGTRNLSPGQYGTGEAREISGCPDCGQGFGHVDLRRSLDPGAGQFLHWETGLLAASGDEWTTGIAVGEAGGRTFRATLAWQDAPAKSSANRTPVNDLDLTVTRPDGRVLHSNGLGESDRLNNIEDLGFAADMPGVYTVKVRAHNVAVAAPHGGQPYALVLRGPETGTPAPAAARFSAAEVAEPADLETAMEGMTFVAADYLVAGGIPAHGFELVAAPGELEEDGDYIFDEESGGLLVLVPDAGTYRFEVAATNAAGTNAIAWVLTAAKGLPAAPTAAWVQEEDATSLLVRWSAVDGATGYRLDVARGTSFAKATDWLLAGEPVAETSRRVEGLSPATAYCIRVQAENAAGTGPRSAEFCVATRGMIDDAAYAAWLAGFGLSPEAHPQGAAGANGNANWVNYTWDISPEATNALRLTGLSIDALGHPRVEARPASPDRHYWLLYRTNLVSGAPARVYLGRGQSVMTNDAALPASGTAFGCLEVKAEAEE